MDLVSWLKQAEIRERRGHRRRAHTSRWHDHENLLWGSYLIVFTNQPGE